MSPDDSETGTTRITATGDDITDVRIVAMKPSIITGRIVADPAIASALPPALQLMLSPIEPGMMQMNMFMPSKMGGDGTFEMRAAAPGRVRISVMGAAGWTIRSVRLNSADVTDAGVEVRSGEDVAGVEVEMTNKVTTVSGLVTNARGEAAKDYSAIAFAQDREKWKVVGRYQGMSRPDQDGRFKITGLPPGDYYVVALEKLEQGQLTDPDFLDAIRAKATAISVHEGETRTVDLKVTSGT
jgi:hypothetical protein